MAQSAGPSPVERESQPVTPEFDLSGGRLCLDFANTLGGHRPDAPREYLGTYADLIAWGRQAGALSEEQARLLLARAERRSADASATLARARALREAIYQLFAAVAAGAPADPADLDTLQAELSTALARARLVPGEGAFAWDWVGEEGALDRMLWPVARSAADLLTSGGELTTVRECGSRTCSWLFLDTSKNHSRQWCDMRVCGNREKARRYYERRKAAQSAA